MDIVLIYISPNGTTQTTARLLGNAFTQYGHNVEFVNIGRTPWRNQPAELIDKIARADIAGFGSAAYHMEMLNPMIRLIHSLSSIPDPVNFRSFFFLNYSGITTGKTFLDLSRQFTRLGRPVIGALKITAPHFHHPQPFPDEESRQLIRDFTAALERKNYEAMSVPTMQEQFQPSTRKVHLIHPFIHWVGKIRELPITIDNQRCKQCGKCVRECPAAAITLNGHVSINFQTCLHCYHCVAACPQEAVRCPVEKLDAMLESNIKMIGMEKPANRFYC